MGTNLVVAAGPIGRGLDGKRKAESETAVSCAGDSRGQGRVCEHGLNLTRRVRRSVPRSQLSTFTQARSPMHQLFLTPWVGV